MKMKMRVTSVGVFILRRFPTKTRRDGVQGKADINALHYCLPFASLWSFNPARWPQCLWGYLFSFFLTRFRPTLGPIRLAVNRMTNRRFVLRLFRLSFDSFQIKHFQTVGSESRPASMAYGFFIGKSFPSSYRKWNLPEAKYHVLKFICRLKWLGWNLSPKVFCCRSLDVPWSEKRTSFRESNVITIDII